MARSLLVALAVLAAIPGRAGAAPRNAPFAVYVTPGVMCDALPASRSCLAAERGEWRALLADDLRADFPHVTDVRLVDLFDRADLPHGGWAFRVVVPTAPARWRPTDLHIELGGVSLDDPDGRFERNGSLVLEVAIQRTQLAPGTYTLRATRGNTETFALEITLETGAADDPDPAGAQATDAAAAKEPPFLVEELPTSPDCRLSPPPAGCHRAVPQMWRELFLGTRVGHAHATTFAAHDRLGRTSPNRHWRFHLVFPTAPARWSYQDLTIQLDGVEVSASPRWKTFNTDALIVQLTFLADTVASGKHELRAIDRSGTVRFVETIDLTP